MDSFSRTFGGVKKKFVCNIKQHLESHHSKLWNVIYSSSCFVQDFSNNSKYLTFLIPKETYKKKIIKQLESNNRDDFLDGLTKLKGCMLYLNANRVNSIPSKIYSYTGVAYTPNISGDTLILTCEMESGGTKDFKFKKDPNFQVVSNSYKNHAVYLSENNSDMPYKGAKKRSNLKKKEKKILGGAFNVPKKAYENKNNNVKIRSIYNFIVNNIKNKEITLEKLNFNSPNNILGGGNGNNKFKNFILIDVLCCVLNHILGSGSEKKIVLTAFYGYISSSIAMELGLLMGAWGGNPVIDMGDVIELNKQKWDFFGRIKKNSNIKYYDYVKKAHKKLANMALNYTKAKMFDVQSMELKTYYDMVKNSKKNVLENSMLTATEHYVKTEKNLNETINNSNLHTKIFGNIGKYLNIDVNKILCKVIIIVGFADQILTKKEKNAIFNNEMDEYIEHINDMIELNDLDIQNSPTGLNINIAFDKNLALKLSVTIPFVYSNFFGKITPDSYKDININDICSDKIITEIKNHENVSVQNNINYMNNLGMSKSNNVGNNIDDSGSDNNMSNYNNNYNNN